MSDTVRTILDFIPGTRATGEQMEELLKEVLRSQNLHVCKHEHTVRALLDEVTSHRDQKGRIPASEWKWFGRAGHYVCRTYCVHHLCTIVGDVMISTVGDMRYEGVGVTEDGRQLFQFNNEPEEVGSDRLYETFVFRTQEGVCACGCGLPDCDANPIDFLSSQTCSAADDNHRRMCEWWATRPDSGIPDGWGVAAGCGSGVKSES